MCRLQKPLPEFPLLGPPIQTRGAFAAILDGFVHARGTQITGRNGHTALLGCELTDLTRIPYKVRNGIASSTIVGAAAQWCKPGRVLLRRTTTHPDGLSRRQGRRGRLRNTQGAIACKPGGPTKKSGVNQIPPVWQSLHDRCVQKTGPCM